MKKILLALAGICFAGVQMAMAQGTYVVNNAQGSSASYHILQHALDSVPAGSIILLQNSGLNYGAAIISKPVVIYGAGYFLGQNASPATQANASESRIKQLVFIAGSQGSMISGVHIMDSANDQSILNSRVSISNTYNITISRCMIEPAVAFSYNYGGSAIALGTSSNITIQQCYINCPPGGLTAMGSSTAILFSNNIVTNGSSGNIDFHNGSDINSSFTLLNNTFYGNMSGVFGAAQCQLFENNIVIINDTAAHPTSNNGLRNYPFGVARNNLTNVKYLFQYDGAADATNRVDVNLNFDSVFVDFSNPLISSTDGAYQLATKSLAKKFGNDGTDAGAYGGVTPYQLSGIPAIPNIYFAQVPQTGTSVGGLKVHLKIHANN
jgi:hypothetical protein